MKNESKNVIKAKNGLYVISVNNWKKYIIGKEEKIMTPVIGFSIEKDDDGKSYAQPILINGLVPELVWTIYDSASGYWYTRTGEQGRSFESWNYMLWERYQSHKQCLEEKIN